MGGEFGKSPATTRPPERSVFIVESSARNQDALREKIKEQGYRVFLSADPTVALNRYRQKPFDALVLNAGTVGEDSLDRFEQILEEAARQRRPCSAIVLLSRNQAAWAERIPARPNVAILVGATLKQFIDQLNTLVPVS